MSTIFLTGFPGFLGSALVKKLLHRYPPATTISCLIQSKYRALAETRAAQISQQEGTDPERIHLINGDITEPNLGLGEAYHAYQQESVEIYHLAAIYDLGVGRELAMRINVHGTEQMLAFAQGCPALQRFQYVSTCYVSGRYKGEFLETQLIEGQTFNNYYEETKYLAEVAVQAAMRAGLPTTIYRPAIVIGDSRTGETQKYDGPYYVMQWIMRQPFTAVVPITGNPTRHEVNIVPRNYVIEALTCLSGLPHSLGQVYHLCDPHPLTVAQLLHALSKAMGRTLWRVPIPRRLAKGALELVPGMQQFTGIEPEAIDYFVQPTRYRCPQTLADLDGSGIVCPRVPEYMGRLVNFMRQHPHISAEAMV